MQVSIQTTLVVTPDDPTRLDELYGIFVDLHRESGAVLEKDSANNCVRFVSSVATEIG